MFKLSTGVVGILGAACVVLGASAAAAGDILSYPTSDVPQAGSPVYAPVPMITGDALVGLSYYSEPGYNTFQLLGGIRANVPLGDGRWNITGELAASTAFKAPNFNQVVGGLHLYHKTPQFAHGVFAEGLWYGETGFNGTEVGAGVEAAAFLTNAALVGRATFHWGDNSDGTYDYWSLQGIGRYYLTPNTKLVGMIEWWSPDGFAAGAAAEHLFSGTNISAFATAAWAGEGDESAWQALLGARFLFHAQGKTLQQHDWDLPFSSVAGINF
jgi:hypothetical protein